MNILDKTRLLQTSVLSSLIMGLGGAAYAQVEQVPASAEDEFAENETIVVTGSRIRRPDLDTVFPTTVVSTDTIDKAAFTNIADALTEIPAFGGGIDPVGDQGANIGSNFVDFLDLGVQRTLTLVNGRRFVSADVSGFGQSVDFNVIPLALVDRIDVVGVGGAPIYGADAIAGTINVILKDDFEGLEATALYGETERGDADRKQFQIVAGANSEDGRSNVTFSAEYFNQDGLLQTARPQIYADDPFLSEVPCNTPGFTSFDVDGDGDDCTGPEDSVFRAFNLTGGSPLNVQLFSNGGTIGTAFGGAPLNQDNPGLGRLFLPTSGFDGLIFEDSGNLRPFEVGTAIPGTSAFFAQGGEPYPFFAQARQIQSPVERINFGSTVRHEINNSITFRADAQIAQTKAVELVNQGGFQTFAFDGTPNNDIGGALQLPVSNPFLNPQARGALADAGFDDDDAFFLSRFNNDLLDGGRRGAETTVWRLAAGLEGEFEAFGGREFFWDAHGIAGQASNVRSTPLLNDTRFLNAIEAVRLTEADITAIAATGNNPIGAAGDIVCQVQRDLALIETADRTLNNAAFAGIRGIVSGSGVVNQTPEDVTACAPLNLFGEGNASAEALDYVSQRGIFQSDIEQRVWSANLSGQLLELPAGWASFAAGYEVRRESALFATGGAIEVGLGRSAATGDSGGSYSTDEISGELYAPLISADMDIPLVKALEAEASIRQISNSVAGDATVWTVGGSYKPIDMLTFRGNKTRSVRAPALTELFQPVVTQFDFADDPCDRRFIADGDNAANRAANCATDGIAQPFTSNIVNASAQGLTGGNENLCGNVTSDMGEFSIDATAFHVIERKIIVDAVAQDNTVGGFGDPRWSGTVDLTYDKDAFRFFWRTLWQDRNLFSPSGNNTFADENDNIVSSVGGRLMHNASVSYDVSSLTDNYDKPIIVQFNVDNVFDRTPGRGLREQFGNFGTSEVLGRRFTMRVRASF